MEGLRDCDTVTLTHYDKFEEPCKFISKDFEIVNQDYIKNRLTQNTGFIVVGVIGKQTVGKSFILNMLANNFDECTTNKPFETSSCTDLLNFSPKTTGTDIHVTADRVILLDTQHILNINHLGVSMEKEKKIKVYSNDETVNEGKIKMSYSPDILTVQVISYLLSVCHVVLVVDDHIINYRLLRLLDLAHRLKPWISCNPSHLPLDESRNVMNHSDFHEFHDYVAQMVFVENMCQKRDLSKDQISEYIDCINQSMIGYRFRTDEQNALHSWLKDVKNKQSMKHNAKLKKKFQQQREKLHNDSSSVVQLAGPKSENGSDEEVAVVTVEEPVDVPSNMSESISDYEDDEIIEKRLNRSIHRSVKFFRMPLFSDEDPTIEQEARTFQQTIFGLPRKHFCVTQNERFTELCWLEYAMEMWHNIRNSQIFTEYFYSYSNILINDF